MTITQTNKENLGVTNTNLPGFQAHDALWFSNTEHLSYRRLAQTLIAKLPHVSKWLEVGSGAGSLMYWARKQKPEILTVTLDGNIHTKESPFIEQDKHFIVRTDIDYTLVDENNETILFDSTGRLISRGITLVNSLS